MRPVYHGDVIHAARALYVLPMALRAQAARVMIARANAAHAYVDNTGKLHPRWGDGSLLAVARRQDRAQEPGLDDADYCACLVTMLTALQPNSFQPAAQSTQRRAAGSNNRRPSGISSPQSSQNP